MTRAAVYLRISLDPTGQEKAVTRQREDALKLIEERGWELHSIYTDNSVSASKRTTKRPEYNRLRADYEAGQFLAIVCYDLDRFTRKPRELEDWIDAAETKGLALVTLNGEADLTTDGGRLFARIKVAVARAEVERKGARQKRANLQAVADGRPAPGRTPYGYKKGGLEPNKREAARIVEAYEHVLRGGSLHGLCRTWNAAGVATPLGGEWSPVQIKKVLLRRRNMGVLERYGEAMPNSRIVPIIDTKTFLEVEAILTARSTSRGGREPLKGVLNGLAVCSVCGGPMRSKRVRSNGYEDRVAFYICGSRADRNRVSDGKRHPTIRATILEEEVERAVVSAYLSAPSGVLPSAVDSGDLGELHLKLREVEAARQRIVGLVSKDLVSENEAALQLGSLARDRDALSAAISDTALRSASASFVNLAAGIYKDGRASLDAAAVAYAAVEKAYRDLPVDQRRTQVRAFLNVTVRPGWGVKRVDIEHKIALSLND